MPPSPRRIALRLQYDGAAFAGSQLQRGRPTVQAALEDACLALSAAPHRADFASRTDAGVHATGQVAAVTTTSTLPLTRWVGGLNHFLPPAVAVQAVREVPLDFNPRRWATARTYAYHLRISPVRLPLWESRAWVLAAPLDVSRMEAALAPLEGEHDFASFAARSPPSGTLRTVDEARLHVRAPTFRFHLRAQSFLPQQARRTVGQVVRIGRGAAEPTVVARLLAEPRCGAAGPAAPPQGLVLVHVRYALAELQEWDHDDEDVRGPEK